MSECGTCGLDQSESGECENWVCPEYVANAEGQAPSLNCCRQLESTPRADAILRGDPSDWSVDPVEAVDLCRTLERELNVSRAVNLDDCHTDALCRDTARPVLGDWVDGDNWGVPSTADIVDRLVNMVIISDNAEVCQPEKEES